MTTHGWAMFETTIGRCAIVWSERGVAGVQLPEANERGTRARVLRRFPELLDAAPEPAPPEVQRAIDRIISLLRGNPIDLGDVVLDVQHVTAFHRRVYDIARTIPPGTTLTYGAIAARLGEPGAARAVGQALGRNPFAIIVPCHRVVAAGGKTGGFSANGGVWTKLRLLEIEGAKTSDELSLWDGLRAR